MIPWHGHVQYPEVPADAYQDGFPYTVNMEDKFKRRVSFGSKEREFAAICEYGGEQLISCYQWCDKQLSIYDVITACHRCPHFAVEKDRLGTYRFDYFVADKFDIYQIYKYIESHLGLESFPNFDVDNESNVYFVSDGQFVKIGVAKNIEKRIIELQTGNGRKIELLADLPCATEKLAYRVESLLHDYFYKYRKEGEWFDILDRLVLDQNKNTE